MMKMPFVYASNLFVFLMELNFIYRGQWKFCNLCACLGRSDNIRGQHYSRAHKEVKVTKRTECYLKVGQRPRIGANHVRAFLNHLGSDTERPETKIKKAERMKAIRAQQEPDEQKVAIKAIITSPPTKRSTRN